MTLSTTDNETAAIQGLLALHDPNRIPSGNHKNSSSDLLYWHSSLSQQSSSCNSPYLSLTYNSPTNNENGDCLVQGMSTMTTNKNISPTTLLSLSGCNKSLLPPCNNETQFIHQSQEQVQQFQEFQQQAYLAHQNQLVRQSQEPRYNILKQQQQRTTLPSIQEMMAHPQHPLLSRDSPTRASILYHSYHNKRAFLSDSHGTYQRQRLLQHQLAKNQLKQKNILLHSQQLPELNMLMQSQQNHRVLASLCNRTEAELQVFFQTLHQFYREEYEKELKQKKQLHQEAITSEEEEDEDGDNDDYQAPVFSGSNIVASAIDKNSSSARKKSHNKKKKLNGGADKPRWTTQEKSELFEAIVRHKSLDVMSTFDWVSIGQEVGRLDKACKDQWRRGLLKMFREYILNSNFM